MTARRKPAAYEFEMTLSAPLTPEWEEFFSKVAPTLDQRAPWPLYASLDVDEPRLYRRQLARRGFRGRRGSVAIDLHRLPVERLVETKPGVFEAEIRIR